MLRLWIRCRNFFYRSNGNLGTHKYSPTPSYSPICSVFNVPTPCPTRARNQTADTARFTTGDLAGDLPVRYICLPRSFYKGSRSFHPKAADNQRHGCQYTVVGDENQTCSCSSLARLETRLSEDSISAYCDTESLSRQHYPENPTK